MDSQLEALQRDVRMLKRALAVAGLAIVALGGAHVIANRAPSELTIGQVTIDETGISVRDPALDTTVRVNGADVWISSESKGGLLLKPGELVMDDHQHRHQIRMLTWSEIGNGVALLQIDTAKGERHSRQPLSGIHAASYGDVAFGSIFTPHGRPFELRSEPPRLQPSSPAASDQ